MSMAIVGVMGLVPITFGTSGVGRMPLSSCSEFRHLAKELELEYGSGFSVRQLEQSRQFYRTYPIANTLCSQLNWSQYRRLIQIEDPDKREYYELESVNGGWTARETERQINSTSIRTTSVCCLVISGHGHSCDHVTVCCPKLNEFRRGNHYVKRN